MAKVYNKKSGQTKRRELRFNQTLAEKTVWLNIRKRQIEDTRFLRQYGVDKYILDFYSPEIKLGIEIDGDSHLGKEEYDKYRQNYIEEYKIKIIRFTNEQVLTNIRIIHGIFDFLKGGRVGFERLYDKKDFIFRQSGISFKKE